MKKTLLILAAAVLGSMALVSCDPEELFKDIIEENSGNVTLTVASASANANQYYHQGDTVKLQTVMCGSETSHKFLRMAGIRGSLNSDNWLGDENFPVFAMNLIDTMSGQYQCSLPSQDIDFILSLENWEDLATATDTICNSTNLMLIAVDTDNYYLATSGDIYIDSVGSTGAQVKGRVANVVCKYLNINQMSHLRELKEAIRNADNDREAAIRAAEELAAIDMNTYFPEVVLNGTFSALRADISRYMNAIRALAAE